MLLTDDSTNLLTNLKKCDCYLIILIIEMLKCRAYESIKPKTISLFSKIFSIIKIKSTFMKIFSKRCNLVFGNLKIGLQM